MIRNFPRAVPPSQEDWAQWFEVAKLHAQVFGTPNGKRLLQVWTDAILTVPIVRPNESEAANGIREGRADFVRQIYQQIEAAKRGAPDGVQV